MTEHPEPKDGHILSFTDHLQELRIRIIICISFFAITFLASFFVAPRVVSFLMKPLTSLPRNQDHSVMTLLLKPDGNVTGWEIALPTSTDSGLTSSSIPTTPTINLLAADSIRFKIEGAPQVVEIGPKTQANLNYLTPLEPFMLWLQGALLLSAVFTIPMLVYQFWLFISPGLLKSERSAITPLLAGSVVLFPLGAAFAYGIMHVTLKVLLSFGDSIEGLQPNLVASSYLGFVLMMMFMTGLVFEFPLVLLLLAGLGIIDSQKLVKQRKVAFVLMSVIAAVATPSPDAFSMMAMLVPLIFLYEGSILAIRYLERRRKAGIAAGEHA